MGRPKDEHYWNEVDKLKDGKLKCRRCKHEFKGGVSRIKAHVDRIQGQGIKLCDPGSVRYSEGVDNNVVAASTNPPQGVVNPMNSLQVAIDPIVAGSSNHPNSTQSNNLCEGELQVEDVYESNVSSLQSKIKELVDELVCEENEVKGQLQWLKSHGKRCKKRVDDWLDTAPDLKKRALEAVESLGQNTDAVWEVGLTDWTLDLDYHIQSKPLVLWNELVGYNFEENFKDVLELLRDEEVFVIGIHGMGGVGKTCLVTQVKDHIKYQITRNATYNFRHVFWVTVSQNFSIFKLQNDIAKRIGITLEEDDEVIRAEILSSALEKNEKWVLILDDVWNYIDLYKVGIPLWQNGTKLILTSRLKHVCQQMDCSPNNIILLEPWAKFIDGESWELFLLKLGYRGTSATLPPEVEEVARSVVTECDGLPLGISVMARAMKGVKDISRWRHALNKLQNSAVGVGREMEEEVFKVLKFSYDNLNDINMQRCFLHCALYFDIGKNYKKEFIMKFVDEGLINGMRSLEEIFDEGLTILDKLISHSLLLDDDLGCYGKIRMHGLVRDVACHIMGHGYMVRCDKRLREMPHIQEWTADLEVVSLAKNMIQEIPASMSPQCPKLSTLIFSHNFFRSIPDSFFSHMNSLTVLDLSENHILTCLPNTLSNLRSLVSLVLRGCVSLKFVPPLGELQKLSTLIIARTAIQKVPQGLEMLINLKWLDLSHNYKLTWEPGYVLSSLTNLQYLDIRSKYPLAKVNAEDVLGMTELEYFAGSFQDSDNFNNYVQGTLDRGCRPKTYNLHLGVGPGYFLDYSFDYNFPANDDCRIVSFGDCTQGVHLLPTDIAKLCIAENKQWKCLCDVLSIRGPSSLMHTDIKVCPKLESLFCLTGPCSLCSNLQNLESLNLKNLECLDVIWRGNDENMAHFFPPGSMFSHIKHLEISKCHKIETLLTIGSLLQLQNLVTIDVKCCYSMKEIFTVRITEDEGCVNEITLPKLTRLEFRDLPHLKTVWRGIIVCGSSPKLNISDCPKLETQPVLQSLS